MNGIDVSSYQEGIDLSAVPCDFAIVKATEGTGYVNPDCDRAMQQLFALGKCAGTYHFASGGDAVAEADFFCDNITGYIGSAILVLDWEGDAVDCGPDWAWQWLCRVHDRTGVWPLIYMSNSVVNGYDWSTVAGTCGLWNAGYYAYGTEMGYTPDAPLYGGTGAWSGAAIYQYSSEGCLDNWGGHLDLDVFYGDSNEWNAYAGAQTDSPHQEPGEPVNGLGFRYRAHVENIGWCDWVHDGQTAGTVGYGLRLEALQFDLPDNLAIGVKAHIQDEGWVDFGGVGPDHVIGTVGESKRVECVIPYVISNSTQHTPKFCCHVQDVGWEAPTDFDMAEGSTGESRRIEAVKFWLE